jgi:hypothetical protein
VDEGLERYVKALRQSKKMYNVMFKIEEGKIVGC